MQGQEYGIFCWHRGTNLEVCLTQNNTVVSSYKQDENNEYMFIDSKARQVASVIKKAINKRVAAKKMDSAPFKLGIMLEANVDLSGGISCRVSKYKDCLVGLYAVGNDFTIDITFAYESNVIPKMNYVKLTKVEQSIDSETGEKRIVTRSLEEISLEKDTSWLKEKHYYIVDNAEIAERIFKFLENYDGPIAYDTETTGLRINCFSKYGSTYKESLSKYNRDIQSKYEDKVAQGLMSQDEVNAQEIHSDTLTGIIFCWKPNESYYFPCGNRMFKNLYEDRDNDYVKSIVSGLRAKSLQEDPQREMESSQYFDSVSDEDLPCDFVMMLRVKDILENKHIVTHNGSFEWRVDYLYDIITNVKDDTMILHQIMYKFKDTSRNSGESSALKHLTMKEFGVDQLELSDFFAGYSESGPEIKGKKKKKKGYEVDFSYMDYNGARAYAPADGDFTLQLFHKYKKDLVTNYKEMEYLYNFEVLVSCAIAYMEFYGHKIDESKIQNAKETTIAKCAELEKKIRELGGIGENEEFNVGSPAQVADLFFNKLGIPFKGDKPSVSKKELKRFKGLKDEEGNPKYPIIDAYSEWKKQDTLLTKFFDNLPNFMFPGGFIFSSFKQIETGTGRMSCSGPNAQQYPKVVSAMVSPRDNCVMLDADYSQIEYRVLTALAKEKKLAEMFSDPDTDYHTLMASIMYGVDYALVTPQMRSDAKSFNFGIPYGMGFGSLAILLRGANTPEYREEAMQKYELYFKDQPNVRQFFDDVKEGATINKYTRTHFNRRRYYSFVDKDGNYSNAHKARALRQAGNAVIQGCLDGDTRIQTKDFGIVKIKDVAGKSLKVWDGDKWSHGDILYSGKKRKCIVKFSNGQEFICSPKHKFLKCGYDPYDVDSYIECKDLCKNDIIQINTSSDLKIDNFDSRVDYYGEYTSWTLPREVHFEDEDGISGTEIIDGIDNFIPVESVEITDEYIDMYDVCNTDGGYYVADGIITHNTAADIFKIAMARVYSYIKRNRLFGKLFIVNMVHDEGLYEIDVTKLDPKVVFKDIVHCMSYHIDGFPPLFVGGGFGMSWKSAKGGDAEIHPVLADEIAESVKNESLYSGVPRKPEDVIAEFDKLNLEFRQRKIADYLCDPKNFHKALHPAIGKLLNNHFGQGIPEDDEDRTMKVLTRFIETYNLGISPDLYKITDVQMEEEDDAEYDDGDEEADDGETEEVGYSDFALIDESDKAYGVNLVQLIDLFGYMVSRNLGVCGVDVRDMPYWELDRLSTYFENCAAKEGDDPEDCLEVVLLKTNNILVHTGFYVKGVDGSKIAKVIKANNIKHDVPQGTIEERCKN